MSIHDRSLYLTYAEALSNPGNFSSNAASFFCKYNFILHTNAKSSYKNVKVCYNVLQSYAKLLS